MQVKRAYSDDPQPFDGSLALEELINTSLHAALDNLRKSNVLTPIVMLKANERISLTAIIDDSLRSTEEIARGIVRSQSHKADMYAVSYAADVQHVTESKTHAMVIVVAGEKGAPNGYRLAQDYKRRLFGGLKTVGDVFVMGPTDQFFR